MYLKHISHRLFHRVISGVKMGSEIVYCPPELNQCIGVIKEIRNTGINQNSDEGAGSTRWQPRNNSEKSEHAEVKHLQRGRERVVK